MTPKTRSRGSQTEKRGTFVFIDRVNENEPPGLSRTPCKCVPEQLPKKLGKRLENDEPRGSKNCLKMDPKMDPKIIAILGCLGAPQTTSNDAPIALENHPENHV